MENDILDVCKDIGYDKINIQKLESAVAEGPKSIEYTEIVAWTSNELKTLNSLEEHVNAITTPDDSSSFLLELSSFLKELGCQYSCLMEGNVNQRLQTRHDRLLLLDYLFSEVQSARMIRSNKPDLKNNMEVTLQESATAADMKNLLIALKFPKPPANITPEMLFGKVHNKMKEVVSKAKPELVGKPLFTGKLSDKQWHLLQDIQKELHSEYRMRREMLIKRLDVTVQSFQWSDQAKSKQNQIGAAFLNKRNTLKVDPNVDIADLIAAREDLAILEKTSSASVRKNTQSSINKVMIGKVPDRGGRPSEQQAPPPEMPSWQQRSAGAAGGGGFGGGRGGGGERGGRGGGDRGGGRIQGGWNQGGGGGFQGKGGGGGFQDGGGYRGGHDRGGGYQDRGGFQDGGGRGGHDHGGGGGGYQDKRGGGGYYSDRGGGQYHDRGRGGRGARRGGY